MPAASRQPAITKIVIVKREGKEKERERVKWVTRAGSMVSLSQIPAQFSIDFYRTFKHKKIVEKSDNLVVTKSSLPKEEQNVV